MLCPSRSLAEQSWFIVDLGAMQAKPPPYAYVYSVPACTFLTATSSLPEQSNRWAALRAGSPQSRYCVVRPPGSLTTVSVVDGYVKTKARQVDEPTVPLHDRGSSTERRWPTATVTGVPAGRFV